MHQAIRALTLFALLSAPAVMVATSLPALAQPEPEPVRNADRAAEAAAAAAAAALATEAEEAQGATAPAPKPLRDCGPTIGCSTKRPLPRFVSIKGSEARARRGPGNDHRVDWVYQRSGLPMKVTAEYENWRRVEDPEGAGGWMHYALLSTSRTAIVTADHVDLTSKPEPGSTVVARAELGVVARILECRIDQCRLSRDGWRGWVPKTAIWGVEPGEIFD